MRKFFIIVAAVVTLLMLPGAIALITSGQGNVANFVFNWATGIAFTILMCLAIKYGFKLLGKLFKLMGRALRAFRSHRSSSNAAANAEEAV